MSRCDVAIVGSSPNALVAAARLAKGGAKVIVLETRPTAGGPVTTEEFAPGFRADAGVASVALDPEVVRELAIGVEPIRRETVTALGPKGVTLRETSPEAELGPAFGAAVELLRELYGHDAPSRSHPEALAGVAARLRGLGERGMHEVLRLSFMSARDFLTEQLGSEPVRALCAGAAVRCLSEGPFAAGTLFGLLHHTAIGDGLFRSTARGGVGKLSEALADAARAAGAEIRLGVAGPLRIELEDGVARGARLGDGTTFAAGRVVSDLDARTTFTQLVSPIELDPDTNRSIRSLRYRGMVARVHLALAELPEGGLERDTLAGTLVSHCDVASIERAWDRAKRGALPEHPYVEATFPTLRDPSLAPEGQHVLDAWVQYVPRGADRSAVLERVLEALAPLSPKLRALVRHSKVSLPEDLEARFGLAEGHLYGGEVRLDQAFFLRPVPGCDGSPIPNLHLSGSAAHPGGYSGRSGWNLAGRLLSER